MAVINYRRERGTYVKGSWRAKTEKMAMGPRRIATTEIPLNQTEIDRISVVLLDAVERLEAEGEL